MAPPVKPKLRSSVMLPGMFFVLGEGEYEDDEEAALDDEYDDKPIKVLMQHKNVLARSLVYAINLVSTHHIFRSTYHKACSLPMHPLALN